MEINFYYDIESENKEIKKKENKEKNNKSINFLTIHSSKGMEFKHVIAIDQQYTKQWSLKA